MENGFAPFLKKSVDCCFVLLSARGGNLPQSPPLVVNVPHPRETRRLCSPNNWVINHQSWDRDAAHIAGSTDPRTSTKF